MNDSELLEKLIDKLFLDQSGNWGESTFAFLSYTRADDTKHCVIHRIDECYDIEQTKLADCPTPREALEKMVND